MEVIHDNVKVSNEEEGKEGKAWVALIYQANGLPAPRKKGGGRSG